MKKEAYIRTELELIEFSTEDAILTSIESMPDENGGGVLVDP